MDKTIFNASSATVGFSLALLAGTMIFGGGSLSILGMAIFIPMLIGGAGLVTSGAINLIPAKFLASIPFIKKVMTTSAA